MSGWGEVREDPGRTLWGRAEVCTLRVDESFRNRTEGGTALGLHHGAHSVQVSGKG